MLPIHKNIDLRKKNGTGPSMLTTSPTGQLELTGRHLPIYCTTAPWRYSSSVGKLWSKAPEPLLCYFHPAQCSRTMVLEPWYHNRLVAEQKSILVTDSDTARLLETIQIFSAHKMASFKFQSSEQYLVHMRRPEMPRRCKFLRRGGMINK